jgi:hypothetical protein
MSAYQEFLSAKKHSTGDHGFYANWIPDCAFDFQRHIIAKAVQKGRIGVFADTGLGKTPDAVGLRLQRGPSDE